jgi:hypothetical protein
MRFSITKLDHRSEDLDGSYPVRGEILRQIPGPDTPNYFLAALDAPFIWKKGNKRITHLIIGARMVGGVLSPAMRGLPINIGYMTDDSLLSDSKFSFAKGHFAAIGFADGEPSFIGFHRVTPQTRIEPNHGSDQTPAPGAPPAGHK